jgi:hypothetical protein
MRTCVTVASSFCNVAESDSSSGNGGCTSAWCGVHSSCMTHHQQQQQQQHDTAGCHVTFVGGLRRRWQQQKFIQLGGRARSFSATSRQRSVHVRGWRDATGKNTYTTFIAVVQCSPLQRITLECTCDVAAPGSGCHLGTLCVKSTFNFPPLPRNATLSEEEILWAIYSISDNNSYLLFNRCVTCYCHIISCRVKDTLFVCYRHQRHPALAVIHHVPHTSASCLSIL